MTVKVLLEGDALATDTARPERTVGRRRIDRAAAEAAADTAQATPSYHGRLWNRSCWCGGLHR